MNASPTSNPLPAGPAIETVSIAERKDDLPVVLEPTDPGSAQLCSWLDKEGAQLQAGLRSHGAVLLRAFDAPTLDAIEWVCETLGSTPMAYADRVTRRSPVRGAIEAGHELSLVNFFDATSLPQLLEETGQQ